MNPMVATYSGGQLTPFPGMEGQSLQSVAQEILKIGNALVLAAYSGDVAPDSIGSLFALVQNMAFHPRWLQPGD